MDLTAAQHGYTHVDTDGKVISRGKGGVVIMTMPLADGFRRPILVVDEVSDDETVNLFLQVSPDAYLTESECPVNDSTHEIIANVAEIVGNES